MQSGEKSVCDVSKRDARVLESPDSVLLVDGETWTSPLEDFGTVSTVLVSRSAIKKLFHDVHTHEENKKVDLSRRC